MKYKNYPKFYKSIYPKNKNIWKSVSSEMGSWLNATDSNHRPYSVWQNNKLFNQEFFEGNRPFLEEIPPEEVALLL